MADNDKQTLGFQAEVKQLLQLMIHSLYSNKEIFLRELISNASDASDKLRFEAINNDALYGNDHELKIKVGFDKAARTITISDNGIGMSRDEAISHLGTIAKSGTKEFFGKLSGDQQKDAALIGQFGVGFYSGFIVADKITVETRRAGLDASEGVRWESGGEGDYSIEQIEKAGRGTDIILHLREGEDEFLSSWKIKSIIRKYSDHISLPIVMQKEEYDEEQKETVLKDETETVNQASALWARSKSDITPEQYEEFYKHVSHDFQAPLTYTHNRVEGRSEYTQLLYIPAKAPFDLWDRNKRGGLKLYVKRVFIMDDAEQLMPTYLRMVKGVIDSADLPLNVSREILQESRDVRVIREGSTKRVIGMLEELASSDEQEKKDKYTTFWTEFGQVLKEGIGEDMANKDRLAKLLRFASTANDNDAQTVSLEQYLARAKEGQDKIYYVTADNYIAAKNSPHLEIFRKKGVEVLLLTDRVDEWMLSFLTEFDGKELVSVAKGGLDLGALEDEAEKKEHEETETSYQDLVGKMKEALADKAKDVRVTFRLTDSPACLVADENELSGNLLRMLKAAGQSAPESKPILEINPDHPLVQRLKSEDVASSFADWANILFDQALLAEGGALADPASFVKRLNELLLSSGQRVAERGGEVTGSGEPRAKVQQPLRAVGPGAVAGIAVDVAGVADLPQFAAPGVGKGPGPFHRHVRIVAAGDHDGRERERRQLHRLEAGGAIGVRRRIGIAGRHQESASHPVRRAGCGPARDQRAAQAMRDQDRWRRAAGDGSIEFGHPFGAVGRSPVAMRDPYPVRVLLLPLRLPVSGPGIPQARQHQYFVSHTCSLSRDRKSMIADNEIPALREMEMTANDMMAEIRDANLSYLMLAQQMIRADKVTAIFRLGIAADIADLIEGMSNAQILKLAGGNMMLARFRFDDSAILSMLTNYNKDRNLAQAARRVATERHAAVFHRLVPDLAAEHPFFAVHQHPPVPGDPRGRVRHPGRDEGVPAVSGTNAAGPGASSWSTPWTCTAAMCAACATCLPAPARPVPRKRLATPNLTPWPRDRASTATFLSVPPVPHARRAGLADPVRRLAAQPGPGLTARFPAYRHELPGRGHDPRPGRSRHYLAREAGRVVVRDRIAVPAGRAGRAGAAAALVDLFAGLSRPARLVLVHVPHPGAVLPVQPGRVGRRAPAIAAAGRRPAAARDRHWQRARGFYPVSGAHPSRHRLRRHRAGAVSMADQLVAGALRPVHGAHVADVRRALQGPQGRTDVDRRRYRQPRTKPRVQQVPERAGRPPCRRVHHRLPAPDGVGEYGCVPDRKSDGQRDRHPPPRGRRARPCDCPPGRRHAGVRYRGGSDGRGPHHGKRRAAAGRTGHPDRARAGRYLPRHFAGVRFRGATGQPARAKTRGRSQDVPVRQGHPAGQPERLCAGAGRGVRPQGGDAGRLGQRRQQLGDPGRRHRPDPQDRPGQSQRRADRAENLQPQCGQKSAGSRGKGPPEKPQAKDRTEDRRQPGADQVQEPAAARYYQRRLADPDRRRAEPADVQFGARRPAAVLQGHPARDRFCLERRAQSHRPDRPYRLHAVHERDRLQQLGIVGRPRQRVAPRADRGRHGGRQGVARGGPGVGRQPRQGRSLQPDQPPHQHPGDEQAHRGKRDPRRRPPDRGGRGRGHGGRGCSAGAGGPKKNPGVARQTPVVRRVRPRGQASDRGRDGLDPDPPVAGGGDREAVLQLHGHPPGGGGRAGHHQQPAGRRRHHARAAHPARSVAGPGGRLRERGRDQPAVPGHDQPADRPHPETGDGPARIPRHAGRAQRRDGARQRQRTDRRIARQGEHGAGDPEPGVAQRAAQGRTSAAPGERRHRTFPAPDGGLQPEGGRLRRGRSGGRPGWPGKSQVATGRHGADGPEHAAHGWPGADQAAAPAAQLCQDPDPDADHRVVGRDEEQGPCGRRQRLAGQAVFFDEAEELLAEMERLLLAVDIDAPDAEDLNAIFRTAHSVKGGASTFGVTDMTEVTHILETLLDRIRKGEMALTSEHVDAFLAAKDILKMQLDGHRHGSEVDQDAVGNIRMVLHSLTENVPVAALAHVVAPSFGALDAQVVDHSGGRRYRLELPVMDHREVTALGAELGLMGHVSITPLDRDRNAMVVTTHESLDDIIAICSFVLNPEDMTVTELPALSEAQQQLEDAARSKVENDLGYGFFDAVPLHPVAGSAGAPAAAGTDPRRGRHRERPGPGAGRGKEGGQEGREGKIRARRRRVVVDPRVDRKSGSADQPGGRAGDHPGHDRAARRYARPDEARAPAQQRQPAHAQHARPAGSGDVDPHDADGLRVLALPAHGARPGGQARQKSRFHHQRRGHRAGQGPDRTHRRSAHAPGAQLDRPWHRNAGRAARRRQERRRPPVLIGVAPGRQHHHRSIGRRRRLEPRTDTGQGRAKRPGRERHHGRRRSLAADLRTGLFHGRNGDRRVGPGRFRHHDFHLAAADAGDPGRHVDTGRRRGVHPAAGLCDRIAATCAGRRQGNQRQGPRDQGPGRIPAAGAAVPDVRHHAALYRSHPGHRGDHRNGRPQGRAVRGRPGGAAAGGGQEPGIELPQGGGHFRRHHPGRRRRLPDSRRCRPDTLVAPAGRRTDFFVERNYYVRRIDDWRQRDRRPRIPGVQAGHRRVRHRHFEGAGNPWLRGGHPHRQRARLHQGRDQPARHHHSGGGHAHQIQPRRADLRSVHRGDYPEHQRPHRRHGGGFGVRRHHPDAGTAVRVPARGAPHRGRARRTSITTAWTSPVASSTCSKRGNRDEFARFYDRYAPAYRLWGHPGHSGGHGFADQLPELQQQQAAGKRPDRGQRQESAGQHHEKRDAGNRHRHAQYRPAIGRQPDAEGRAEGEGPARAVRKGAERPESAGPVQRRAGRAGRNRQARCANRYRLQGSAGANPGVQYRGRRQDPLGRRRAVADVPVVRPGRCCRGARRGVRGGHHPLDHGAAGRRRGGGATRRFRRTELGSGRGRPRRNQRTAAGAARHERQPGHHGGRSQLAGGNGVLDGRADLDREAERGQRAPGQPAGGLRLVGGREGRQRGVAGGHHHGVDQGKLEPHRGHHRRHRRHRVPDQHPGPERGRGSRPRGRAGPRLCRGGVRSAQPGPALRWRRPRDQGTDQRLGGKSGRRQPPGGRGRQHHGADRHLDPPGGRHHGRDHRRHPGTKQRHRGSQPGHHPDGRDDPAERRAGGRSGRCRREHAGAG
uniref:Heat shock protein 83 n=1 Tax=Tanacetum cinerariifolium TaxID=118510 RepID=A0A699GEU7_TANCI|nr:heat shock protein 83 [Tanacetum cinerariifolium]